MGHRGPDDEGVTLIDPYDGTTQNLVTDHSAEGVTNCEHLDLSNRRSHRICLGHRRFSIIDLSPSGHQPLWNAGGSVCIAFNGEIYNYVELRDELVLMGYEFRSTSDSEVLVAAYQAWGTKCLARFNGFWALSLYDTNRRQILLSRDRLGKAPLYVAENETGVFWASEINGLRSLMEPKTFGVREQSVVDFLKWQRRDIHHTTFFEGIRSFPSACHAWITDDGIVEERQFWSIPTTRMRPDEVAADESADRLGNLLNDSVRLRLRADVQVAVQLSGGLDSSTILALAAANTSTISAFTVAFPDSEVDEEPFARKVVEVFGDKVEYIVVDPPDDDLLANADDFVALMGEPFHSPNQFSAHRVWQTIASHGYKVNLYGSGGDEVLAGYSRFYFYRHLRGLIASGQVAPFLKNLTLFRERSPGPFGSDYLKRAAMVVPGMQDCYDRMTTDIPVGQDPFVRPPNTKAHPGPSPEINQCMIDQMSDMLLNYWLRIDNQNSMSVPLELRSPFLDYRVVEFAFSMPMQYLIRDGWMKWLLRKAMNGRLPDEITWRKRKMGFPFPLQEWLGRHKGPLLEMARSPHCPYLDFNALASSYDTINRRNSPYLWCLISLAMWWKKCIQGERLAT